MASPPAQSPVCPGAPQSLRLAARLPAVIETAHQQSLNVYYQPTRRNTQPMDGGSEEYAMDERRNSSGMCAFAHIFMRTLKRFRNGLVLYNVCILYTGHFYILQRYVVCNSCFLYIVSFWLR